MLVSNEEYIESRLEAVQILKGLKDRRKNVRLKRFFLEKDTYVYIEDNNDANNKFQRFRKKLQLSRKLSKSNTIQTANIRETLREIFLGENLS